MALVEAITQFSCPGCASILTPLAPGSTLCPGCGWTGQAYLFAPVPLEFQAAEQALPNDAICIHHPRKKATAVCAGTGDYICSLCAVELDGETFSAAYLATVGKKKAGQAFERNLPRPDSRIVLYLILPFIPYVNFLAIALAFIWIPHGYFLYLRALRMRRENPLFARLMGTGRVVALPILLSLEALAWVGGVIALIFVLVNHQS